MHIFPTITIDTEPARIASVGVPTVVFAFCLCQPHRQKFPQMSPIATLFPPATQNDVIGTFQRKQDCAVSLLSSSPLLSYANFRLQGEIDELRSENLKMRMDLEAAAASLGAFRSQVASLEEVNVAQQQEINSLREELLQSKDKHSQLVEDSKAERDALRSTISDLEVSLGLSLIID